MDTILGASWRTSLTGYAVAGVNALLPVLQGGRISLRDCLVSMGIAVLGRFARDHAADKV